MKVYGGVEVQLHASLISTLDGGEWSVSHHSCFILGKRAPITNWKGGWVGPATDMDVV